MKEILNVSVGDYVTRSSKFNAPAGVTNGKKYRVTSRNGNIATIQNDVGLITEIDLVRSRFWVISEPALKPVPAAIPEPIKPAKKEKPAAEKAEKPKAAPKAPPRRRVPTSEEVEAQRVARKMRDAALIRSHEPETVNLGDVSMTYDIVNARVGDVVKYIARSANKLVRGHYYTVETVENGHFTLKGDPIKKRFSIAHYSAWTIAEKVPRVAEPRAVEDLIRQRGSNKYAAVMQTHGEMLRAIDFNKVSVNRLAYLSMVLHKVARLANGYGSDEDNLLDISGYSELERAELLKIMADIKAATTAPQEVKSE